MADQPATKPPPALTRRQRAILRFVVDHVARHDFPPVIREIQGALGISSTSVVTYHLGVLQDLGLIRRTPHVSRSIVVLPAGHEALR